jgi:4-hydroxybenzoyl-CoA thioesterase
MFVFQRPVRFGDVDAARLVFFPRFLEYCHDALEALFAHLDGGYPRLTQDRGVGIPTVHVECDFHAPLRYGDVARLEIDVLALGRASVTVRHTIKRDADGAVCAVVRHVFVTAALATLAPVPIPDDVRDLLSRHLAAPAGQA